MALPHNCELVTDDGTAKQTRKHPASGFTWGLQDMTKTNLLRSAALVPVLSSVGAIAAHAQAATGSVGTFNPATAVSSVDFTGVGGAITAGAGIMLGISALWLAYSFVKRAVRRAA